MDGDFLHNREVAQRTDASGMTVLHWVCLHQDAPTDIVVKVVFANPYAVHMRNDAGHLPIDLAVQADCGERILEVLRAAARGNHRLEASSDLHKLINRDDEDGATETTDYHLSYNNHTILHPSNRDSLEIQPQQNHTYYEESDDEVDDDELEYQQNHQQYHSQAYLQQKKRLERKNLDHDSYHNPPQGNYGDAGLFATLKLGNDRNQENSLSRSDPHVKSLLTEQRLRERENDLISIATADDSMPLGMFDPSHFMPDISLKPGFSMNEDVKIKSGNLSVTSRGAGPRSQTAFPPRWKQSSMCHVCACAFSLVKRRHHCRNCGQSVCSQHSTNRVALPKFALSEAQRVCDQCFLSGHHMMIPGGTTPSIASSYQSFPGQIQREQLQEPFHTHVQFQH
ncbi:putative FYVE zinc finger, Zinc finger, FYVE/PHD-type, Zinc finger, RING/FYVE/PHD-type [Plasmopara halstedii]